jgi:hypothetical protein
MLKGTNSKNSFIERAYKGLLANSSNDIKTKALS